VIQALPDGSTTFALRVQGVSVTLGKARILSNVSIDPPKGKITAVVGPNGAGKTTLFRAILGLIPFTGTIKRGRSAGGRPFRMGYVPQRLDFDRGMPMTVRDFLCCGLQRRPLWLGHRRSAIRKIQEVLERIGAGGWEPRLLGTLSGGELQRTLLAMALARDPDILLLDEPVAGVDAAGEQMFCDLLGSLQAQGHYTMLLVNHDLSIVTRHADYVICLNQSVHCEGNPVETLTAGNLKTLYRQEIGVFGHDRSHEGHAHCDSCAAEPHRGPA
jgi:zinc transport system ATP-binding protein